MAKPATLFMVTDIETTLKYRVAFDVAWKIIDRNLEEYGRGSFVVREAFTMDVPFFKEKLGHYFDDTYRHLLTPASIHEVREEYNGQIKALQAKGHRVICAAYNAGFDFKHLPDTYRKLAEDSTGRWLESPVELLDIWEFWCQSAPRCYNYATPKGNPKTSAEYVYRFETQQESFVERHIAWSDVGIEGEILQKVLARKQAMPVVKNPNGFSGQPWRILKEYPAYISGQVRVVE